MKEEPKITYEELLELKDKAMKGEEGRKIYWTRKQFEAFKKGLKAVMEYLTQNN